MHAACLQNAHVRLPRIDADGSGAINKEEFVRPLTRWIHESKTAPRFVKYNVDRSLQAQVRSRRFGGRTWAGEDHKYKASVTCELFLLMDVFKAPRVMLST